MSTTPSTRVGERGGNQPRLHSPHPRPGRQLPRAIRRGKHVPPVEGRAPRLVEVVRVVFMAEEDGVDGREVGEAHGRSVVDG